MEQWTVSEPFEGLFRMHINFGGSEPFWCMFDFAVSPDASLREVDVKLAADADAETVKWFIPLRRGIMRAVARQREEGREYVGIRIVVSKIHAYDIDTTEKGCERYGAMFVASTLNSKLKSVEPPP